MARSWPAGEPSGIAAVDARSLFGAPSAARDVADAALLKAASELGFLILTGLPEDIPVGPRARTELLRIFALPEAERHRLWRRKFAPDHPNVYRGFFPVQPGNITSKEGIDLGPDLLYGEEVVEPGDPLRERTPLPPEQILPGWRAAAASYYLAMERVSVALLRSIARSLGLAEHCFEGAFARGLSTLRLLRYPVRDAQELASCTNPGLWIEHDGRRHYALGEAHTDSGFVTLLAQDGVPGLQARRRDGRWVDVPPREGTLVVNFGQVLERWCGGRIRATEHRVLGSDRERHSIPFFLEARADAEIAPLPIDPPTSFAPFLYGDYLWARIVGFVEFRGMAALRPARRPGAAPWAR